VCRVGGGRWDGGGAKMSGKDIVKIIRHLKKNKLVSYLKFTIWSHHNDITA
jgi:hypothetical protein